MWICASTGDPPPPAGTAATHLPVVSPSASVDGPSECTRSAPDPRGLAQSYSLVFTKFFALPSLSSNQHGRSFASFPPSPSPTSSFAAYSNRWAPAESTEAFVMLGFLIRFCSRISILMHGCYDLGELCGSLLARLAQGVSEADADE